VSRPSTQAIAPCSVYSLQAGNPLTSPKLPRDANQLAKSIVDSLMGQNPDRAPTRQKSQGRTDRCIIRTMRGEGYLSVPLLVLAIGNCFHQRHHLVLYGLILDLAIGPQ
jgi:hypothetical protein